MSAHGEGSGSIFASENTQRAAADACSRRAGFLPIMPHHDAETVARIHAFDAWDTNHRKAAGFFAGLGILPKVTRSTVYLAWRHWPHLLCWQWIFTWNWSGHDRRFFRVWKSGPGVAGGLHIVVRLFWLGYFSFQRQASDRIPNTGPRWLDAPVIFAREPDQ